MEQAAVIVACSGIKLAAIPVGWLLVENELTFEAQLDEAVVGGVGQR